MWSQAKGEGGEGGEDQDKEETSTMVAAMVAGGGTVDAVLARLDATLKPIEKYGACDSYDARMHKRTHTDTQECTPVLDTYTHIHRHTHTDISQNHVQSGQARDRGPFVRL